MPAQIPALAALPFPVHADTYAAAVALVDAVAALRPDLPCALRAMGGGTCWVVVASPGHDPDTCAEGESALPYVHVSVDGALSTYDAALIPAKTTPIEMPGPFCSGHDAAPLAAFVVGCFAS